MTGPEWVPILADERASCVYLCCLSEADLNQSSFLDQRIASGRIRGEWVDWPGLGRMAAGLPERLGYIFHIGHVGSTLLSRLLAASPAILGLREPAALRTLAQIKLDLATAESRWSAAEFEQRLAILLRLWSRTHWPVQRTLLKATSFVSEMASDLLGRPAPPQAILLGATAETYLATIFGGANSRVEIGVIAPNRLKRLHRRLGAEAWRLHALSEGETIAMSWACEMTALATAANAYPGQTLWLDFDRILAEPRPILRAALRHVTGDASELDVAAMLVSPDFRRYAKAPEHAYDAALRRQVLDQARGEHGAEIARGLDWLENAATRFPPIAEALEIGRKTASIAGH